MYCTWYASYTLNEVSAKSADGTVNILAHLLNKNIGTIKIYYDIFMVIISAIFVGKTLTLMKKHIQLEI